MSVSSSLRCGGGVVVTWADSWSCDLCNLTHQDLPLEGLHTCFKLRCCHLDILNNFEPEALHYYFSLSSVTQSCLTLCDPMDCSPTRLLCPWSLPGKNTGVGCHFLLQGIFPTQGSNLHLLHLLVGRRILCHCTTWKAISYP